MCTAHAYSYKKLQDDITIPKQVSLDQLPLKPLDDFQVSVI